jgi:hypothetical protein
MAGIAQQGDIAIGPTRQWITIDQSPFVHRRAGVKHGAHLGMEIGESLAQFAHVAHRRPGLDGEAGLGLACDEIELAARGPHPR